MKGSSRARGLVFMFLGIQFSLLLSLQQGLAQQITVFECLNNNTQFLLASETANFEEAKSSCDFRHLTLVQISYREEHEFCPGHDTSSATVLNRHFVKY